MNYTTTLNLKKFYKAKFNFEFDETIAIEFIA